METKEQKILWKILKEMYAVSNPPIDLESSEDKEISYRNHVITEEKYNEIMEANLSNQRLTKLKKQMIRNSVANFAPKFSFN